MTADNLAGNFEQLPGIADNQGEVAALRGVKARLGAVISAAKRVSSDARSRTSSESSLASSGAAEQPSPPMEFALDYELVGCANNAPVVLTGNGSADPGSGRMVLTLGTRRVPLGWDPALVLLGGLDVLLLASAARGSGSLTVDLAPGGLQVEGRTHAEILDDQGRDSGTTTLAWLARREGDVLSWRGQLLKSEVDFESLERVTTVPPFRGVVISAAQSETIVTSTHSFETNRGSSYRCVVTTRSDLLLTEPKRRAPQFHLLTVEPVRLDSRQEEPQSEFELIARIDDLSLVPR